MAENLFHVGRRVLSAQAAQLLGHHGTQLGAGTAMAGAHWLSLSIR